MKYIIEIIVTSILIFNINLFVRFLINNINGNLKLKYLLYDSFFISIFYLIFNFIGYFLGKLLNGYTINPIYESILVISILLGIPCIYIIKKKKFLINKNIILNIYYPLVEVFVILFTIFISIGIIDILSIF